MLGSRAPLLLLGVIVVGAGWLGCATSNGDPVDESGVAAPRGSSSEKPGPGERPAFEAGFEDDANVDPTPDGGDTCVDNDDAPGTEIAAKALPGTDDAQNTPLSVTGVMNGAVDVDVYKLSFSDLFGHSIGSSFDMKTSGVEMCVFVRCKAGDTTVSGCAGGVKNTNGIGMEGCCASGPAQASPQWDCPGFVDDDSADFFIQIKQTKNACVPYSFSYVF